MGPLPAGPHAKSIWLLLIRRDRHSAGKPKPSSWYRQTLWPLGSTSLSSSLLAGATPWTSKVKAYASGSGNEKRLLATTKPPPPLKSKSSRRAPPRGPLSREMSSCACPDATGLQPERSVKSSRTSPFMVAVAVLRSLVAAPPIGGPLSGPTRRATLSLGRRRPLRIYRTTGRMGEPPARDGCGCRHRKYDIRARPVASAEVPRRG